jgi:RimJ/RimL family protein N-acetyltransferase
VKNEIIVKRKNYFIEKLDTTYIDKIMELCVKCSDYFNMVEGEIPNYENVENIFTELPPNSKVSDKYVFGIFYEKNMIGIIDFVNNYKEKDEGIIGLMLIEPEKRNSGLGSIIHKELINFAKILYLKKLRIGVVENNKEALLFWEKVGYK